MSKATERLEDWSAVMVDKFDLRYVKALTDDLREVLDMAKKLESLRGCVWNEPLHDHHDGCPAEYVTEQMNKQLTVERDRYKAALEEITKADPGLPVNGLSADPMWFIVIAQEALEKSDD